MVVVLYDIFVLFGARSARIAAVVLSALLLGLFWHAIQQTTAPVTKKKHLELSDETR